MVAQISSLCFWSWQLWWVIKPEISLKWTRWARFMVSWLFVSEGDGIYPRAAEGQLSRPGISLLHLIYASLGWRSYMNWATSTSTETLVASTLNQIMSAWFESPFKLFCSNLAHIQEIEYLVSGADNLNFVVKCTFLYANIWFLSVVYLAWSSESWSTPLSSGTTVNLVQL